MSVGFDPGPATGSLNAKTHDAIRDYQRALGLDIDGQPSKSLLSHLRQISGLRK
ncbi:MAG: peptidoglycan-binding protein [Rhodospirillaceae bacterium]|nr:peptidoglycan-binding protein [Rhodospirillaceae bacterium]